MVDWSGLSAVHVELALVLLIEVLLVSLLLMPLLLIAGLDVVDEDDERVVEVMADAELDAIDAVSVTVGSVEVLLGLAFEDNESDDEGMPLAEDYAIEALEILNDILDGSALDGEETLLDDPVPNDE